MDFYDFDSDPFFSNTGDESYFLYDDDFAGEDDNLVAGDIGFFDFEKIDYSDAGSDFSFDSFLNTVGGIAQATAPIWTNVIRDNQRNNSLYDPTRNPALSPLPVNSVGTTGAPQATKVGFLTGTTIGDGLIIGAIALMGLFIVLKD